MSNLTLLSTTALLRASALGRASLGSPEVGWVRGFLLIPGISLTVREKRQEPLRTAITMSKKRGKPQHVHRDDIQVSRSRFPYLRKPPNPMAEEGVT